MRRALGGGGHDVGKLAAFFVAYMAAAAFGRWMMVIPDIPVAIWPPNGIVLAMLLTQPRRSWPWWIGLAALGELAGNVFWFHNPLGWALGYIAANASAVILAALALARVLPAPFHQFTTLRQVLSFLAIGVLAAPVVSATLGSAIDVLAGKNPFTTTWPVWWLGDATGILIATPLAISLANAWRERAWPGVGDLFEGAIIAVVLVGLALWVLSTGAIFAFLLHIPILWAAIRYEFRGTALAVLALALTIGAHAQSAFFPVLAQDIAVLHTKLQALLVVAASTGLIVAAIMRQQRHALRDLARANDDLEFRVEERTRAIEAAEQRFKATFQNAGVGIAIVSGDGVLMRVNDSLSRMLDYRVDEMEGHRLNQFAHPADIAKGEIAWEGLKSGAEDDYELERRFLRKNGDVIWGLTTVSCVRHEDGRIAYLIKVIQDITARKQSEVVRLMLMREVNHRSKNLLSIVQVIARQTAAKSPQDFVVTFGERLQALAANQDLLVNSNWQRVALSDLVKGQLDHIGRIGSRVSVSGPPVMVPPSVAQTLGIALHELATNAAKYGSLSNDTGRVEIAWSVENDDFCMSWTESGGPSVTPPTRTGFGTTVLDRMTATSLSGDVNISYLPEGVQWHLRCPLSSFQESPGSEVAGA